MAKKDPFRDFVGLCKSGALDLGPFEEAPTWQQCVMSRIRAHDIESHERDFSFSFMWRFSLATLLLSLSLHVFYLSSSLGTQYDKAQMQSLDPLSMYSVVTELES